jgi:hypothetical protein
MIFQGTVHRSNSYGGFAMLIVASFVWVVVDDGEDMTQDQIFNYFTG